MNTINNQAAVLGRRRRKHSDEFKAQVAAACSQPGVSIAAVSMAHGVNANLARRWIIDAREPVREPIDMQRAKPQVAAQKSAPPPPFVLVTMPLSPALSENRLPMHPNRRIDELLPHRWVSAA